MMIYADYDFYRDEYLGTMPEADFPAYARKASTYLDQVTFDRIRAGWERGPDADKIRMGCCAVADAYRLNDQGGEVTSQTVGPWTKTFAASGKTGAQRLYETAAMYLSRTGLMYRGC